MKKFGITTIVLVLAVVAILVVAYVAYVGFEKTIPAVGESKDPTGQNREPIAYSLITINGQVAHPMFVGWLGKITTVSAETFPYVNSTGGTYLNQVYREKLDPLGLLNSNFEGWITMSITGPNNYVWPGGTTPWKSPTQSKTVDNSGLSAGITFGPFPCKWWDSGTYTVLIGFWRATSGSPVQLGSSYTLTINVA